MNPSLLEARGLTKTFPGVRALQGVDLSVERGEVLAVIGENGAGKSTLMKILAGVERPDGGEIRIEGRAVTIDSVETALRHGIALIHQELNLADNLDVAANIFLGRERRFFGFLRRRPMEERAVEYLAKVGLECKPTTLVRDLPIGQQQLVEIAKALSVDARLLIMDEPTSSLSRHETDKLFAVIRDLKDRGVSVVYISHRLGEVKEIADRVCVLRDGCNSGAIEKGDIDHSRMIQLMVGRELSSFYAHTPHQAKWCVLEVRKLRTAAHPRHDLSFRLHEGEIVGVAGLVGAGRTELLQTLFGISRPLAGEILVNDRKVELHSPFEAIAAGLALVPEDRKQHGLILEFPVRENLSLPWLFRDQRWKFVRKRQERRLAADTIERLHIRTPGDRQVVQFLSGGNQQKVVLGKWLSLAPKVLLMDEPTRGVDIGAKAEIYQLMERLVRNGVAILFASSEMEEILAMSDRALVMHEGRIAGELARAELSENAVMRLATGEVVERESG